MKPNGTMEVALNGAPHPSPDDGSTHSPSAVDDAHNLRRYYAALSEMDAKRKKLSSALALRPGGLYKYALGRAEEQRRTRRGDLAFSPLWQLAVLRSPLPPCLPSPPGPSVRDGAHLIAQLREAVAWHLRMACFSAGTALKQSDAPVIDAFLYDLLRLRQPRSREAREDLLEALWQVLRSRQWARVEREPLRYLRRAVSLEARGVRRDRLIEAGLWRRWREHEAQSHRRRGRPGKVPDWAHDPVLDELRLAGRLNAEQVRLTALIQAGISPAEALRRSGLGQSAYVGLRAKVLRRQLSSADRATRR